MKVVTTYKRMNPDTIHGNMITIQTVYSSFDDREIDALEDKFKRTIAAGIVAEYKLEDIRKEQDHE